jgi:hypothetical protein
MLLFAFRMSNWHPLTWLSHMLDCQIFDDNPPPHLDTLAVAYSEARRFAEASEATRRAVTAAESAGQKKLAAIIQSRLKFYAEGRTYREFSGTTRQSNP